MKTKVLLTVTALVLLAGCQKPDGAGRAIRFRAVTVPEPQTKTAYSGVVDGGWERIDWVVDDVVRIYSDLAVREEGTYHWADYQVSEVKAGTETRNSKAELTPTSAADALNWGTGSHKFVGVYPAPAAADAPAAGTGEVTFSGTIPTAQTGALSTKEVYGTADTKIFYASNATMYLTAYATGQEEASGLTLAFTPAFSAFHISAGTDQNMTIHGVTLSAETNPIAGAFTGSCNTGWSFSSVSTEKTITFSMGDYGLTAGQTVDLVILALPLEMSGLTLTFDVTPEGGSRGNRSLPLKVAKATTLYGHNLAAGDYIIFDPTKQAYISGLLVPGWNWTVDGDTNVIMRAEGDIDPWTTQDPNLSYGDTDDPVINAGKLSGTSPNFNFNLYSPVGKQWKVTVLTAASGGSVATGVTVTRVNKPGSSSDPDSGNGELTGTIGGGLAATPGLVEFSLSGTSGAYWLSFSVIIDGVEYSINSEVARMADGGPKDITL